MRYEWQTNATGSNVASANKWSYFNSPEDGARVTKGWFKVVPEADFDYDNSEDGDEEAQWYYTDGDGLLYTSQIKKIKGKYYAFDENGAMLSGLVLLENNNGKITVIDDEVDSDEADEIRDGSKDVGSAKLYYFGGEDDGAMRTGNVTVDVDGSSLPYHFASTGGVESRGEGTTGTIKKVYYNNGRKIAASSDDKYRAVTIGRDDAAWLVASKDLRKKKESEKLTTGSKETVYFVDLTADDYYLIATSGKLKTNATGVKDGDDWYFYSDADGKIYAYADSKDFTKTEAYKNIKASLKED